MATDMRRQAIEATARRALAAYTGEIHTDAAGARAQRALQLQRQGKMHLRRLRAMAARGLETALKALSAVAGLALAPVMLLPPAWLLSRLWPAFYFDLSGGWWAYITRHTPLDFAVLFATLLVVIALPVLILGLPLYAALRSYQAADRTFAAWRDSRRRLLTDDDPAYLATTYRYQLRWGQGGETAEEVLGGVGMAAGTLASAVAHVLCLWLLIKMIAQAVIWSSPDVSFWTHLGAVVLWTVLVIGGFVLIGLCAGPLKSGRALRRFTGSLFSGDGFRDALREAVNGYT